MNCEVCRNAQAEANVTPHCETPKGCPLPPLIPEAARMLELRGLLVSLHDLVGPETICRQFGADMDDLRMLADLEDICKKFQPIEQ
jgi:hypothetical protein